jgi:hypothetical protein
MALGYQTSHTFVPGHHPGVYLTNDNHLPCRDRCVRVMPRADKPGMLPGPAL